MPRTFRFSLCLVMIYTIAPVETNGDDSKAKPKTGTPAAKPATVPEVRKPAPAPSPEPKKKLPARAEEVRGRQASRGA